MLKEEQLLSKRLLEYAGICYQREIPVYSDFLNLNEQTIFLTMEKQLPPVKFVLTGGYEPAERKIVCFLPSYGEEAFNPPLAALRLTPVHKKYSEALTHRDCLGAIMNLGIQRSKVGDILISSHEEGLVGTVLCIESMAGYIKDHLTTIRHTNIHCEIQDLHDLSRTQEYQIIEGSIASNRLDSILALACRTSRGKTVPLITGEKVYINGRLATSNSSALKEGDILSVRGVGKFLFAECGSLSRKGRYHVVIKKYC